MAVRQAAEPPSVTRWRAGSNQPLLRGWLHVCAVPFALAGLIVLVAVASTPEARVVAVIYGLGAIALFTVSGTYHRGRWYEAAHLRMKRLDHGTIFLMIAGTYTPICVLAVGGTAGTLAAGRRVGGGHRPASCSPRRAWPSVATWA